MEHITRIGMATATGDPRPAGHLARSPESRRPGPGDRPAAAMGMGVAHAGRPGRQAAGRSAVGALLAALSLAASGAAAGVAAGAPALPEPAAGQRLRAWGDGERLELLPLQQSRLEVLARSQVTLLIRPHDLPRPYAELLITPPVTLDGNSLARQLRLCRIAVPVRSRPARCLEPLPLRLESRHDRVRLQLQAPLQPGGAYGLELLLRNPLQQGFHPLRLHGVNPEHGGADYLGTWLLQTFTQSD